tara:strand:- start:466 stop:726 length:261 start_codon:yes stop_codon:yes gene_type:complete
MIEVNLVNLIGVAVMGNMLAYWFTPIQGIKQKFINLFSFLPFIDKLFNCSKCTSFWFGIILFFDLPAAALCSFLGFLIYIIIDKFE